MQHWCNTDKTLIKAINNKALIKHSQNTDKISLSLSLSLCLCLFHRTSRMRRGLSGRRGMRVSSTWARHCLRSCHWQRNAAWASSTRRSWTNKNVYSELLLGVVIRSSYCSGSSGSSSSKKIRKRKYAKKENHHRPQKTQILQKRLFLDSRNIVNSGFRIGIP